MPQTILILTAIDLIAQDSIEMRIAAGLNLKQNLFDSVLNVDNDRDIVDFSKGGRAQFLKQLEEAIGDFVLDQEEEEMLNELVGETDRDERDHDLEIVESEEHFYPEEQEEEISVPHANGLKETTSSGQNLSTVPGRPLSQIRRKCRKWSR